MPSAEELRRLGDLPRIARALADGVLAGRRLAPRVGASSELFDRRPYLPGDDVRAVDWRVSARSDRTYVRLFHREAEQPCLIVLDAGRSMDFRDEPASPEPYRFQPPWRRKPASQPKPPPLSLSKFEYGVWLAAALSVLTLRQGDRASLTIAGTERRLYLPPGGGAAHLHRMLHTLETAQPDGRADLALALPTLHALQRRRGLLVVISDLLEEPAPLFDALARFRHSKHQILLLQILTRTERDLPGRGLTRYQDAETEATVEADPEAVNAAYRAEIDAWLEDLGTRCRTQSIRRTLLSPDVPFPEALASFLDL